MTAKSEKKMLIQNTYEWFQHRKNYINASEVAAIMNLNPYESPMAMMKKKLFGSKFETNAAVEHGKRMEPEANLFFSLRQGCNYEPQVFAKGIYSASLDGYDETSQTLLEIKCPLRPNSKAWKDFFKKDEIPIYYYAQIQCQLWVSETQKAYFLVYMNSNFYKIQEVTLKPNFIMEMHQKVQNFYDAWVKNKNILANKQANFEKKG